MMRVKGLTGPQADSVHRIRGLMAPQTAGRRSQAALDSDAAARRQVHMDDIASSDPRLVARKSPPLDKNGLWLNLTAGRPLGVPYEQGLCHVFLLYPVNDIPFIACMRYRRGTPERRPAVNLGHSQTL